MSLATQIIDQQVSGIMEKHSEVFADELRLGSDEQRKRSAAFLFLVARTAFEFTDEEAFEGVVDGGNDFGVDALYFEHPDNGEIHITLIQGKYKTSLSGDSAFPENGIANMIAAIGALFDPTVPVRLNPRLEQRVEDIRSFVKEGAIPRVIAIAANNGTRWTTEAQQRIDNAAKDFNGQVEWRYIGAEDLLALLQARQPINAELRLVGQATVETFDFRRVLIGRMSVAELARLTNAYGNQLFERNIRRYLGLTGNRVNEAVADTLRDPEERSNFYFYNNGITITCSQFRHNALQRDNWPVQVDDLQIVNGRQTARTVQQVHRETEAEIEGAEVLIRIYELRPEDTEVVDAITRATNSQNPVNLRDLKANEPRQKALAASITGLGYTYRVKRGDPTVPPGKFTSTVVAEAVLAVWRKRPHQVRFGFWKGEYFGALYDTIFDRTLNGAQAIVASLLLRHAENRRRRRPQDAPPFLAYASRFIAMLMGRYLLEEMGIPLDRLDHRNFTQAQNLVEQRLDTYMSRAEQEIEAALQTLFNEQKQPLQRLSATFRRADLIDILLEADGESSP